MRLRLILIIILLSLGACERPRPAGWIDGERILHADSEPENWMSLGGNFSQQHYSPLELINSENVKDLGLAWEYDASSRRGRVQRGLEATPIVVDGVMYTSGAWGVVYALDAKTGKEIWRYDPDVDGSYARRACCDVVNRGVQVWKGKVYVGVLDGYLVCLDAKTGKIDWRVDTITDRERFYTVTGPPQIAGDVVVIGNSGGEFGVRGYITAYELASGKQAWRFFVVPGDPKNGFEHPELAEAAKTWDAKSNWESGLGGTVWGEFTYDPNLDLLYVGTGNSSPYPIWFRSPSGGDNLYLASILAIKPSTGKLVWHYQTTPGEIWDYTCSSTMTLADLEIEGKTRKVIMQAPKNGFYYVLDRETGQFISAQNFVPVNWASSIDKQTGRPVVTGDAHYQHETKVIYPGPAGGHNWQPMSYSPKTQLAYIPSLHFPFIYSAGPEFKYSRDDNTGVSMLPVSVYKRQQVQQKINSWKDPGADEGALIGWDPVLQKERWRVKMTIPNFNGGVLSTAGNLVFQGTTDGYFVVYQAETGKEIKRIETGTGIMAAPMTYSVDGEQYVAVMAGFGGAELWLPPDGTASYKYQNNGRILVYKLGGGPTPMPPPVVSIPIPEPPATKYSKAMIDQGGALYGKYCGTCHGRFGSDHGSMYPDLSKMNAAVHGQFKDIVLKGILSPYGMASFSDVLSEKDVESLHAFLTAKQQELFK
jgi:quinohemoprotein ethanol dehydrogenase